MKIKNNFMLSEIEGEYIVITIGDIENTFNGYLKLNETSAYLWKKLEGGIDTNQLINEFQIEYEIDKVTATIDVNDFIESLRKINAVES